MLDTEIIGGGVLDIEQGGGVEKEGGVLDLEQEGDVFDIEKEGGVLDLEQGVGILDEEIEGVDIGVVPCSFKSELSSIGEEKTTITRQVLAADIPAGSNCGTEENVLMIKMGHFQDEINEAKLHNLNRCRYHIRFPTSVRTVQLSQRARHVSGYQFLGHQEVEHLPGDLILEEAERAHLHQHGHDLVNSQAHLSVYLDVGSYFY